MILKKGDKGEEVKKLQTLLGVTADGDFGNKTDEAVKQFQKDNGLVVDGIVGEKTLSLLEESTTDNSESFYDTPNGLTIEKYYLPKGEYKQGPTNKEYIFLHHTAGWHNPYKCIDQLKVMTMNMMVECYKLSQKVDMVGIWVKMGLNICIPIQLVLKYVILVN
jgi:peptidoglycan hydrolase-like protein with peptidoglycan-binding domain